MLTVQSFLSLSHTHTHTHTNLHTHAYLSHTHTHTLTLSHSVTLSLSLIHRVSHTYILSLFLTHCLSLSLSHTYTHTLSLSFSHVHIHNLSLSYTFSLFPSFNSHPIIYRSWQVHQTTCRVHTDLMSFLVGRITHVAVQQLFQYLFRTERTILAYLAFSLCVSLASLKNIHTIVFRKSIRSSASSASVMVLAGHCQLLSF